MKKFLMLVILIGSLCSVPFAGRCDDEDPFPPPPPSQDPDTPAVPLDGGVSLLIAAGIGYGAKKTYDLRKKKSNNDQSV